MNETTPPPFSGVGNLPVPEAKIAPEPPVRLRRLLLGLAVAVAVFDLCFWHLDATSGLSVAVFFTVLAAVVLCNRESSGGGGIMFLLLAMLAGAIFAAVIETGITNTFVLLILIAALSGYTYFTGVESLWGRWLSQLVALVFAPGRVFWLSARLMEASARDGAGWAGRLFGGCLLTIPALVLALVFGLLLSEGNAVFDSWADVFFNWFWSELEYFLDPGRFLFWCFAALAFLPLLRPARISERWWKSTKLLAPLPEIIPARAALFSSGLVLVVLNLLFLAANSADVLFLWSGRELPKGSTYSGFVHNGVNALIVTVILSALVLATIFQQESKVSQRGGLKLLGIAWIVQNLFLLLSVLLRLENYIEAYDMTVSRLSTLIFLALVAVGYGFLAVKILRDKSFSWLLGRCVLAVFFTLYITQFLNLAGWTADYNVARWEKNRSRNLDLSYLTDLGPSAWPALRRAHELAPNNPDISRAWTIAQNQAEDLSTGQGWHSWRNFSLRAYLNRSALEDKK